MVNAMQALPVDSAAEHEVVVRTGGAGTEAFVEVADSGPWSAGRGSRAHLRALLLDEGDRRRHGLGLFVCRNIVRGLSGDVTVSDRPGGGAVFQVIVPAIAGAAAGEPRAPSRHRRRRRGAPHRRGRGRRDGGTGAVAAAPGGGLPGDRDSRRRDRARHPRALGDVDLIYCDLMMTGMTGMDLGQALAIEAPDIGRKMVFMTGGAFSPRAREFVAQHADRTVDKPFDIVAETLRRLALIGPVFA